MLDFVVQRYVHPTEFKDCCRVTVKGNPSYPPLTFNLDDGMPSAARLNHWHRGIGRCEAETIMMLVGDLL